MIQSCKKKAKTKMRKFYLSSLSIYIHTYVYVCVYIYGYMQEHISWLHKALSSILQNQTYPTQQTKPIPAAISLKRRVLTYLQEGHRYLILLEEVSIHGSPLQDQANDTPLVVEGIIHLLLLRALGRLCVVSAEESRKPSHLQRQKVTGPTARKPALLSDERSPLSEDALSAQFLEQIHSLSFMLADSDPRDEHAMTHSRLLQSN